MDNEKGKTSQRCHPKEKASIFSHLFFVWQLPILFKGYKKKLSDNELLYCNLKDHQSELLGNKLEDVWLKEVRMCGSNASLKKVLIKVFGLELALYGLVLIPLDLVLGISLPLLIGKLLTYYTINEEAESKSGIYVYTFYIVAASFLRSASLHSYWFGLEHLGMKMRVACSSLIYKKSLKLNQETIAEITAGQIVNLLSNDVFIFNCGLIRYVHFLWLTPIQILVALYFLLDMLGTTTVMGIVLILAFVPLQMFLSKRTSVYRSKVAQRTDRRVRLIKEIIEGIKVIKMLTWEKPLAKLIENFRVLEITQLKSSLYTYALSYWFSAFLHRSSTFLCVFAYIMTNHTLNARYIFVTIGMFELLKVSTSIFLVWGATFMGEIIATIGRIESFLKSTELHQESKVVSSRDIRVENVSVKYDKTLAENILSNITLTVQPNDLIAIVGAVGSGKSTLLRVILNEITLHSGLVSVGGTISYASQEPWLFVGTVRDNIIFGETFNEAKYTEVVRVCALESDFRLLPYGDMSLVGDRGIMLSGGQKARVNLARSIYRNADFYLLDDPLSAVDASVARFLFDKCIKQYLKEKGRVLVTHQLQFLPEVDRIYLIEKGKVAICGTYQDLRNNEYFRLLRLEKNQVTEQRTENMPEDISKTTPEAEENLEQSEALSRLYRRYLKASGTFVKPVMIILLNILTYTLATGNDYFLANWVNSEQKGEKPPKYFLYIYTGSIVGLIMLSLGTTLVFVQFFITSSINLHSTMLNKIMHAPVDFFNINPSGRILNRFSSDIGCVDRIFPVTVIDAVSICFQGIIIIIFMAVTNYWILIPALPLIIFLYFFRNIFLITSRNLQRLEAKSRSPMFTHLTSTLQGSATTRALESESYQKSLFESIQDRHSSSSYMFLACSSAFGFWVDFCCLCYFGIVIFILLFVDSENAVGNIGLMITQCLSLIGMVQYGAKRSGEMENQMVSIERILEYSEIDSENIHEGKLSKEWPLNGKIEFQSVSLRYRPECPLVLKQVTFMVNPGEKIGIVGRTGAGKSSLISVFFRLFKFGGRVLIDDLDIKTIPLETLRSKMSIIPQDPLLFSCSIRTNLDPLNEYQDSQLWDALDNVKLRNVISELPAGLSTKVTEGGSNFSVGQRQLLCLARAILKMNHILILDEATANVDLNTDELIQATIGNKFKRCTVLTIAHRLHTVMDCNKILVMDNGEVVEFDDPATLLQNTHGKFYELVKSGKNY